MSIASVDDADLDLREQLSSLRGLLALSMLMTVRRDPAEITHLAMTAVPALVSARPLGAHLTFGDGPRWQSTREVLDVPAVRADVLAQLQRLPGSGGRLSIEGEPWAWALGLLSPAESLGVMVVASDDAPSDDDLLLLRSLAQQTGIALANARLHASHQAANTRLTESIAALRHKTAIHDRFTQVALDGTGHQGVVDALFELTNLPAVIEDRSGEVLAAAGPADVRPRRAAFNLKRDAVIERAARAGHPIRMDGRLLTVARPHADVVGVLMLVDPAQVAGDEESVALEHGATVLAIELARLHGLAETELRLGRSLVADLVSGASDEAFERAQALGHDMHRAHRVIVVGTAGRGRMREDLVLRMRDALGGSLLTSGDGPPPLLMQSGSTVVTVVTSKAIESNVLPALLSSAGRDARIGLGSSCRTAADYPRSHREAQLALRFAQAPRTNRPVIRYEDLGVYQLLSEQADPRTLDHFMRRWLGLLIDYDDGHGSELVTTLSAFLESGGSYDRTALALMIGRSTVRYRVRRIQQLTGHDLADADTRFQLQLATRAWSTLRSLTDG